MSTSDTDLSALQLRVATWAQKNFPAGPPPGLREALADCIHEVWAGWMRYMFTKTIPHTVDLAPSYRTLDIHDYNSGAFIKKEQVERWQRQMTTPYNQLPEDEQRSDLADADKILKLLQPVFERISWLHCTLGVCEEAGELAHAMLKRSQGIRGTKEEHDAAMKDACGDITVYMMDLCRRRGWSLQEICEGVVGEVTQRDWKANPVDGSTERITENA